jgi:hypothetical protein
VSLFNPTAVMARSGRVVAAQLQVVPGSPSGLSLVTGAIGPRASWSFARSADVAGGQTVFDVCNPTTSAQRVTVEVRLPSGPVHPLTQTVAPETTWAWSASATNRVPNGVDYAVRFTTRGPGVVVGRIATAPPKSAAPQLGLVIGAVVSPDQAQAARTWLLAAVAAPLTPAVPGAAPLALDLVNPNQQAAVAVTISALANGTLVPLPSVRPVVLPPGQFSVLGASLLAGAAGDPLVLTTTGPVVAMEDLVPAGMAGIVSQTALPVAG